MSYPRLYSYDIWMTRTFVRESLKALFPSMVNEINTVADPGEYGLENWYCRVVCCFIFMLAVVDDFSGSLGLATLLYKVPSKAENWIKYEVPDWGDKTVVKAIHGWNEINFVKFEVAGMPLHWKITNVFVILLPKLFLWVTLVSAGFHFLMETAPIVDLVVNAMALTFILEIDEMLFQRLGTASTKHIMDNMADIALFDAEADEAHTEADVLHRFRAEERRQPVLLSKWALAVVAPRRLILVLVMTIFFTFKYFYIN